MYPWKSISLEFAGIMMKYMDNIDRDHSMTLDHFEFAFNYAAMTHASAEAVFDILDENKDGKLSGKFGPNCSACLGHHGQ